MACGIGQELYVFGGVRNRDADNPESSQMTICKSEFFHDELKRSALQSNTRTEQYLSDVYVHACLSLLSGGCF